MLETGCKPYKGNVYTPFVNYGPVSLGSVATYPWNGPSVYPEGIEDFRLYGPTLPEVVECGSHRDLRDHLDVTAGCLTAVSFDNDTRGELDATTSEAYRSFALPYDAQNGRQVAWQDQGVEYRFNYARWSGTSNTPGFKAVVRYLTENDLYVGSWRRDGSVVIQKKRCAQYTTLGVVAGYGEPAPDTWHTIRFQIVGTQLQLAINGALVLTANDNSITAGTAGIRIDSADGAYIDDWRVYAP